MIPFRQWRFSTEICVKDNDLFLSYITKAREQTNEVYKLNRGWAFIQLWHTCIHYLNYVSKHKYYLINTYCIYNYIINFDNFIKSNSLMCKCNLWIAFVSYVILYQYKGPQTYHIIEISKAQLYWTTVRNLLYSQYTIATLIVYIYK